MAYGVWIGLFSQESANKGGLGVNFGREKQKPMFQQTFDPAETGWDPRCFAAVLAPGQMSPPATKYKEITRG